MENPKSSIADLRSPLQARDDRAQRRRESGTFSVGPSGEVNVPTPRRRLPFAPPDVATAAILHSLSVKRQKLVAADLMGDIEDEEDKGMSSGSEEDEDVAVVPKGVAPASTTQVDMTLDPENDITYIDKERVELQRKHESAGAEVVTPSDLQTARHKRGMVFGSELGACEA